ncbi:hypothetical protein LMG28614_02802 [Paraburkholderia ultramafica]|uniref:Uncharacterized protein n=1 Tax=Paraburkholderia ultramafica TaxID=1544867 RepID=A0A6S7B645_9BURK|nr:hypothetical protein LMG28614_02802 [Paraburkholderia ultramafica]
MDVFVGDGHVVSFVPGAAAPAAQEDLTLKMKQIRRSLSACCVLMLCALASTNSWAATAGNQALTGERMTPARMASTVGK